MSPRQLKTAFTTWVEVVGQSPRRTTLKKHLIPYLTNEESISLQNLCAPIPTQNPRHRTGTRTKLDKKKIQPWDFRNIGAETLGELYDFLSWAVDQQGYGFSQRHLNKLFPEGRPGTDPAP